MTTKNKKILLIDANSMIHRAFHALPDLKNDEGKPTGALYGLANSLLKILKEERPDYILAAFDSPEDTFRKEMFEEYKAQRPETPEALKKQLNEAEDMLESFGITTVSKTGFEADDILATLNKKFKSKKNTKISILTGDLDTLQLASKSTEILTPKKGVKEMKRYGPEEVKERFSIKPEKLPDYKGLAGDKSDNIPGVEGIGDKTAQKILSKYSSLEDACKKIKNKNDLGHRIQKLADNQDKALLSKKLAILKEDIPIEIKMDNMKYKPKEIRSKMMKKLDELGFTSLKKRLQKKEKITPNEKEEVLIFKNKEELKSRKKELVSKKKKIAFHWKPLIKKMKKEDIEFKGPFFDIKIAAWILDPDEKRLSLESITKKFLGNNTLFSEKKEEKDKKETLKKIFHELDQKIKNKKLEKAFKKIDAPLIEVLADMELTGIKTDNNKLKKIKENINKKIERVSDKIYEISGEKFNINSPKQVGKMLFEKMGIEDQGKTKSGQYKTSESVLESLKDDNKIAELILKHRKLTKINSTYIKPILKKSKQKERIHADFLQTTTATGRLSSQNPNMQNIPKGEGWAKKLRESFIPKDNFNFLSFDYSQLELRLLAHLSGDQNMKSAFHEN
ncbi:MAG: DNA polymerase, partial [Candidatus Magasanikbacteria bacterium]